MSKSKQRRAALTAASHGSEAITELLRFHSEGPADWSAFGDIDVIANLSEALALACGVEAAVRLQEKSTEHEYLEAIGTLQSDVETFIQNWCG